MAARRVTTVACADDMHRLKGYNTLQDFIDHVSGQTDLEVDLQVDDDCVYVSQLGGAPGQMTFAYPFAAQDIVDWTYHWENDNSIRYEVHSDVENILDISVFEGETDDQERVEELRADRTERVLEFVAALLWERWIDLDGIDLLIMDPKGGPLELTATFEWLTPTTGGIARPCRPADRPAVARLYADGRLALTWPSEGDDPVVQDGVERPLRDLVVVDLAIADDPLDLYDQAYAAFWTEEPDEWDTDALPMLDIEEVEALGIKGLRALAKEYGVAAFKKQDILDALDEFYIKVEDDEIGEDEEGIQVLPLGR